MKNLETIEEPALSSSHSKPPLFKSILNWIFITTLFVFSLFLLAHIAPSQAINVEDLPLRLRRESLIVNSDNLYLSVMTYQLSKLRAAKIAGLEEALKLLRVLTTTEEFEATIVEKCQEFNCDPAQLIRVMYCESSGNPNAVNGVYKGLFQHDIRFWASRAAASGLPGADIFDPYSQIHVSAWMFGRGMANHWGCK